MQHLAVLFRRWFANPLPKPVEPDWAAIDSYTRLADAAAQCFWLDPDAFLSRPMHRLLQIASPPLAYGRGAGRIMEFAGGVWHGYSEAAAARGEDKAALDARALAMVEAHFADNPDGDYLIDVFEGLATHNYCADVPRSVRKAGPSPGTPQPYSAPRVASITAPSYALPADWRDFLALTKPRVMSLVVFTGLCGLIAARTPIHPVLGFTAILCIALGAGAAGALNQWYEADLDVLMKRTRGRPLPAGRMEAGSALHFGVGLGVFSVILMGLALNLVAAGILALSILFYVFVYTIWLKRRTPQNIVIGGAAGAFPPLIGWAAATGDVALLPVLLFGLIFLWTPPHFWALALFVKTDYANAGVPMLPVVAGERSTRAQIGLYTIPMAAAAILPWPLGLTGAIYGATAGIGTAIFAAMALQVATRTTRPGDAMLPEKRLFKFSILYLFVLFAAVAIDRGLA